jgi:hypothetical protein
VCTVSRPLVIELLELSESVAEIAELEFRVSPGVVWIERLCIARAARGRGAGSALRAVLSRIDAAPGASAHEVYLSPTGVFEDAGPHGPSWPVVQHWLER